MIPNVIMLLDFAASASTAVSVGTPNKPKQGVGR